MSEDSMDYGIQTASSDEQTTASSDTTMPFGNGLATDADYSDPSAGASGDGGTDANQACEGCLHAGQLYGEGDQICMSRTLVAVCERLDGRLQWRRYAAHGECDDHPLDS